MNEQGIGNLGVAAMIAGYSASDNISIAVNERKASFFADNKERLENFISWLLNENGCSERTFSVKINTIVSDERKLQLYQCVYGIHRDVSDCLALSGGLDSLSSYIIMTNEGIEPYCSFVNYGQVQLEYEFKSFKACIDRFRISPAQFKIDTKSVKPSSSDGWPLDGFKIPARNFTILALMDRFLDTTGFASDSCSLNYGVYSGEIMEKNRDKSLYFFDECSWIFSEYNGIDTIVRSPVADMSKIQQLQFLDDNGELDFALETCRTCTSPTKEPCLNCKPCFNRMLSVHGAGFAGRVPDEQWKRLAGSHIVTEYHDHIDEYTDDRRRDIDNFLTFLSGW